MFPAVQFSSLLPMPTNSQAALGAGRIGTDRANMLKILSIASGASLIHYPARDHYVLRSQLGAHGNDSAGGVIFRRVGQEVRKNSVMRIGSTSR